MQTKNSVFLQFIRHYTVSVLRIVVSFVFGMYVSPELFGSFIKISFTATIIWFLFDFGLKEYALQNPDSINLAKQKSVHLWMSLPVIIGLLAWAFLLEHSIWQRIWILSFAGSAFASALAIPSYIRLYWDSNIKQLAQTDLYVHGILQPFSIFLLINNYEHAAFLTAFIFPNLVHSLFTQIRVPIALEKPDFISFINKNSAFLGINDFFQQLKQKADTLLLAQFSSTQLIGIYNRGYTLPHHAYQFIQAVIQPILIPKLSSHKRINRYKLSLIIVSSAGFFLLIPPTLTAIISHFWRSDWQQLFPYLPFFTIWAFIMYVSGIHETLLKGNKKNGWLVIRNGITVIITLSCIAFFHTDLFEMLAYIVLFQSIFLLGESTIKIRELFELDNLIPISEAIALLLFYIVYW
ncbi:hypothetical protein EP331_04080 [bacterium]|nr:MAG: hypothetical protein EP331_04080 [bacterium]